ncbi:MAG TPA: aminotransferase class I/II-fold pyridoxal phosphate-dependent enzyme [Candidatus Gallimonas intestinigallinarum]|uniref:Aminotransferase n=1 Tax=Candidatus Gallimonas intestinigallinarum TaxID=2838604 RepID=A0A9D2DYP8_9FIRM|nr:aminotransferase class I/II-fold pyridoxal phosphate-dependent enzyme [Candidatus Gallimonas intestinigallinarum]
MRDFLTERARQLKPSGIRKYFDILDTLPNAISLGVGEPDFVTPWDIRSAGIRSLQKGYTSYPGNRGLPELRQLISRYLAERFQVDYPADRIIITVGASEGIDLALRTTCEEGDEVLVPDPAYVSYAPIISLCGGVAAPVHCKAENGFIMTPEAIEAAVTPRTKAIILAYPNNPTGAVMTREQLEAIVPVIEKYDLLIISDEIYAELTYGGKHCSVASLPGMKERTVLLSGFSKAFAMTGWRIGYACAPEALDKAMLKVHQYTMLCAPRIAQHAAVAALSGGFQDDFASVAQMRAEYDKRRRFLVKSFNDLGLTCFEPRGAFYAFPSVESTGLTGEEFVEGLLKEEQVAVVPGNAFGACGDYHVRCSYATGMRELQEAVTRIARFTEKLRKSV